MFHVKGSSMLYLSQTCLECPSSKLAFMQPYEEGINLCKRAVAPLYIWKEPSYHFSREADFTPLIHRINFLLIGIALLIPIINTVAILILRALEKKEINDLFAKVNIYGDWKKAKIIFLGDTDHTDKGQSKTRMAFFHYVLKHHPFKNERPPALLVEAFPFIDDSEYQKSDYYKKISEIDLNGLNLNGNAFKAGWENLQKYKEHIVLIAKKFELSDKIKSEHNKLKEAAILLDKNMNEIKDMLQKFERQKINKELTPELLNEHEKYMSSQKSAFKNIQTECCAIDQLLNEKIKEFEIASKQEDQLLFERNLAMISSASKTAETASRVFVEVGSGHLKVENVQGKNGEPGGILNYLKQTNFPFECAVVNSKKTGKATHEDWQAFIKNHKDFAKKIGSTL